MTRASLQDINHIGIKRWHWYGVMDGSLDFHTGKRYNGNGQKSLPCNRLPTATNNKLLHIMSYCTLSFNRNGIEFSFMSCPIPNGNKCI